MPYTAHTNFQLDNHASRLTEQLAQTFAAHGQEVFLVGGALRDRLLFVASSELDFATSAVPAVTAEILADVSGSSPHRMGEKFGTIGAIIDGTPVEVTTYRSGEAYESGSRKPIVQFGRSIVEDLSRRDFTINALAWNPVTHELLDPYGGQSDLRDRILRAVGDADRRFAEDPLRILRGIRFASGLHLTIEPSTWAGMRTCCPLLKTISRERIRDEFSRYVTSSAVSEALTLLRESGCLEFCVPELEALTRMPDHGPGHPLSLWDHTMRVVCAVEADLILRWAALVHDIAKPITRTEEPGGRIRFFHHETRGAETARRILLGLRYPGSVVEAVALLVESHMQMHAYAPDWSDGAVRRLRLRLGPNMGRAILLARADAAGHSIDGSSFNGQKFDWLEERLALLDASAPRPLRSPLSGDELMARYARPPGPWIGSVKDALAEEVIDGRLDPDDRESAYRLADRLLEGA